MAIARDSTASGQTTAISITISTINEILIAVIGSQNSVPPTSIAYAGTSMTLINSAVFSSGANTPTWLYSLVNPSTGTNNFTFGSTADAAIVSLVSYTGVDTTTPWATTDSRTVGDATSGIHKFSSWSSVSSGLVIMTAGWRQAGGSLTTAEGSSIVVGANNATSGRWAIIVEKAADVASTIGVSFNGANDKAFTAQVLRSAGASAAAVRQLIWMQ